MNLQRLSYWLLVAISLAYFAFPNARLDFTPYNSHDSESYMAISTNLLEGRGYTRSLNEGEFIPHTLWPPGMAVLLMPAIAASDDGVNLLLVKLTIITIAVIGAWLTRWYLLLLGLSRTVANLITVFLLLNPYYWHFSRIAMAEMPTYTWLILSLSLIHITFTRPKTLVITGCCGLIAGLGMMIKGALLGLPLAILPYLWRQGLFTRSSISRGLVFGAAFCLPFLLWMARNSHIDTQSLGLDGVNQVQMITKKVIEDPNSEFKTAGEIIQTAKQNVLWHGIYHVPNHVIPAVRFIDVAGLPLGNILALGLTALVFVVIGLQYSRFMPVILCTVPTFAIVIVMTIGGAERYWFSLLSIFLMVVYAAPFTLLKNEKSTKWLVSVMLLLQSVSLSVFIYNHQSHPYTSIEHRDDLASLFDTMQSFCAQHDFQKSNVWTINNHALQLTTSCRASMVNAAIGVNPVFDYAVLDKQKLLNPVESSIIDTGGNFILIALPVSMTQQEIQATYYGR